MELHTDDGWKQVGPPAYPDLPPGSFSSDEPTGREVFMFGWVKGEPGVFRSKGGVDIEDPFQRTIVTQGLERLSDLSMPYEMVLVRPSGLVRLRFRYE